VLFRDEASYQYTLEERMKQSGTVQISSTTATQKVRQPTQVGQPLQVTTQSQTQTVMREEGEVAKKVADADYFLTGLIYSAREVRRAGDPAGMRYFQFQFRMTDAQTNIIVWEKEYPVKREGTFR
jgi:PBP1b-binding outer membrane lipoprotein LpoB